MLKQLLCAALVAVLFASPALAQTRPELGGTGSTSNTGADNSFLIGNSAGTAYEEDVPSGTCDGTTFLKFDDTAADGSRLSCAAPSVSEVNNLESDGAADIEDTEIFIGTGSGTGNYATLSGGATLANDGTVTIVPGSFLIVGETVTLDYDGADDVGTVANAITGTEPDSDVDMFFSGYKLTQIDNSGSPSPDEFEQYDVVTNCTGAGTPETCCTGSGTGACEDTYEFGLAAASTDEVTATYIF